MATRIVMLVKISSLVCSGKNKTYMLLNISNTWYGTITHFNPPNSKPKPTHLTHWNTLPLSPIKCWQADMLIKVDWNFPFGTSGLKWVIGLYLIYISWWSELLQDKHLDLNLTQYVSFSKQAPSNICRGTRNLPVCFLSTTSSVTLQHSFLTWHHYQAPTTIGTLDISNRPLLHGHFGSL